MMEKDSCWVRGFIGIPKPNVMSEGKMTQSTFKFFLVSNSGTRHAPVKR